MPCVWAPAPEDALRSPLYHRELRVNGKESREEGRRDEERVNSRQKYSQALQIIPNTGFYSDRDGEPMKGILLNVSYELVLADNGAGI